MENKGKVTHLGVITDPPYILCRNSAAAERLRIYLHMDYSRVPDIIIVDDWPEEWNVDAVAVTPIMILGTNEFSSFSITTDLDEDARNVLNQIISFKRSHDGDNPNYREIGIALGLSRRRVQSAIKKLRKEGIIEMKDGRGGISTNIGKWMPNASKAEAHGVEIKEY